MLISLDTSSLAKIFMAFGFSRWHYITIVRDESSHLERSSTWMTLSSLDDSKQPSIEHRVDEDFGEL